MIKNISILLMCFVFAHIGQTQNLVLNGGFEEYDTCPDNGGQLNRATPWIALPQKDIEFFHKCSVSNYTIPLDLGYTKIYPNQGLGFAGFLVGMDFNPNFREYLQGTLSKKLTEGYFYIEYFVRAAPYSRYGIKNIDIHFSNDLIPSFDNHKLLSLDHFKMNSQFLIDTVKWVKVSGIVEISSGKKYFLIGNFTSDSSTESTPLNVSSPYTNIGYFIDDVSVIPVDSIEGGIPANAGPDQTIFTNDSVFIGQNMSGNFCQWYRNGTLITPTAFGFYDKPTSAVNEYVVVQNLGGVIDRDTAYIYVKDAGLKQIEKQIIQIAPNPSTGKFSLQFKTNLTDQLPYFITDLSGKIVKQATLDLNQGKAELELVEANGVYFLHVKGEVHKLIIQK